MTSTFTIQQSHNPTPQNHEKLSTKLSAGVVDVLARGGDDLFYLNLNPPYPTGFGCGMYRRQKLGRDEWIPRHGLAITSVGRSAADLLAAGVDGGHIGRFLGDAFARGAATVEQVSRSTKWTIGAIEALVAQSVNDVLS